MSARSARLAVDQAAGRSAPLFLTSILSLTGALDALRLPTGAAPVRIGFVVLALMIGIGLTVAMDRPGPRPYWQMTLLVTLILMPVVALQASASRVPFVAISRGSAGPLLWLTLATCITLVRALALRRASVGPIPGERVAPVPAGSGAGAGDSWRSRFARRNVRTVDAGRGVPGRGCLDLRGAARVRRAGVPWRGPLRWALSSSCFG